MADEQVAWICTLITAKAAHTNKASARPFRAGVPACRGTCLLGHAPCLAAPVACTGYSLLMPADECVASQSSRVPPRQHRGRRASQGPVHDGVQGPPLQVRGALSAADSCVLLRCLQHLQPLCRRPPLLHAVLPCPAFLPPVGLPGHLFLVRTATPAAHALRALSCLQPATCARCSFTAPVCASPWGTM